MTRAEARRLALISDGDTARLIRTGTNSAARLGAEVRRTAIAAYQAGRDPIQAVQAFVAPFRLILVSGMLASRLAGIRRARLSAPPKLSLSVSTDYTHAVGVLRRLLDIDPDDLDRLTRTMDVHALEIARDANETAVRRIRGTIAELLQDGAHVREGVKRLRETFKSAGIVPQNSFTLEGIFRTQSQLAYAAGKLDFENSPPVQEILWGYQYSTVGDDRVRPEHAVLEGVTLPRGSEFWQRNYPPNGWACRCSALALYEAVEIVLPPGASEVNGKMIVPGADVGFRFRADRLFGSLTSIANPQLN